MMGFSLSLVVTPDHDFVRLRGMTWGIDDVILV